MVTSGWWLDAARVGPRSSGSDSSRRLFTIYHSPFTEKVMPQISNITESIEAVDAGEQNLQIPESLPVLPLRDIVIYPFMIVPLFVSREKSIRAVDEALGENRMIFLVSQRDLDKEEPAGADLFTTRTLASITRMLKLPDGRIRILVQGLARARGEEGPDPGGFFKGKPSARSPG